MSVPAKRAVSDFCVIGAGIVGLATARTLLRRHPGSDLVVLEKEDVLAQHQTSHNSGVVHTGIYYAPGSLKAQLCRAGEQATKQFAAEHGITVEVCGKLLVATSDLEAARMNALHQRSVENGISVERLDAAELRRVEPNVTGVGALRVPHTAIVDYPAIARALADEVVALDGRIETGRRVSAIRETSDFVELEAGDSSTRASRLVVCGGLQADRLARMAGLRTDFQIVPFRGEYYRLATDRADLIEHLIYPIPDPDLPFLGVHLTRTLDGGITVGPNAVLGFAREGYPRWSFDRRDVAEYARFPGLWRVARTHARTGARELWNSSVKRGYLKECRKYCPSLRAADLLPEEAGIRAQAVLRDGTLVHDFLFRETDRSLHVCNAPSPAATSALPIAAMIADRLVGATTG